MWQKKYHYLLSPLIQFIQYQFLIYGNFHMLIKPKNLLNYRDGESSSIKYIRIIDYCHHIITPSFFRIPISFFLQPSYVIIFLGKLLFIYAPLLKNTIAAAKLIT
ncbi:unnamed protein product [Paramecium pentaurelia]|uniref:Uncharacterized protein n=1 Tax=Paramecium pentaurelia TaxID=43138 RepID=A0A8S1XYE6_9CILI|nr:unnamed protein product [Paramecium pentaurelia]